MSEVGEEGWTGTGSRLRASEGWKRGPSAGKWFLGRTGSAGWIGLCLDEMQPDGRYPLVRIWVTRKRLGCGDAAPPVVCTNLGT